MNDTMVTDPTLPPTFPKSGIVVLPPGDLETAWLLTAASQIFLMQLGFICLETGFVEYIWAGSIIIKNLEDTFVGIVTFIALGYTLSSSKTSWGIVGSLENAFLMNVSAELHEEIFIKVTYATTCATIISGAVLERMRNKAYLIWCSLVLIINYSILSFWVWNEKGWLYRIGFTDCAGSIVVHGCGGIAGVIAAKYLGPRRDSWDFMAGKLKPPPAAERPDLVIIGTFLLWWGWFAFNVTSPLIGGVQTVGNSLGTIGLNTMLAPCGAAFTALAWMQHLNKKNRIINKISYEHLVSCTLVGAVASTASCYTAPWWGSLIIGIISTPVYFITIDVIRNYFEIDDPLGIGAIHFTPGFLGCMLEGIFAHDLIEEHDMGLLQAIYNCASKDKECTDEGFIHFGVQIGGSIVLLIVCLLLTYILWHFLDKIILWKKGTKVRDLDNYLGLELFQIYEERAFKDMLNVVCIDDNNKKIYDYSDAKRLLRLFYAYLNRMNRCKIELSFLLSIKHLKFKSPSMSDEEIVDVIKNIYDYYIERNKDLIDPQYLDILNRVVNSYFNVNGQYKGNYDGKLDMFDGIQQNWYNKVKDKLVPFLQDDSEVGGINQQSKKIPFTITDKFIIKWEIDIDEEETLIQVSDSDVMDTDDVKSDNDINTNNSNGGSNITSGTPNNNDDRTSDNDAHEGIEMIPKNGDVNNP